MNEKPDDLALKELEFEMKLSQSQHLCDQGNISALRGAIKTWKLRYENMKNRAKRAEYVVENLQVQIQAMSEARKAKKIRVDSVTQFYRQQEQFNQQNTELAQPSETP